MLDYHDDEKKRSAEKLPNVIKAGFAERIEESKVDKGAGIVTEVGPVVAQSVLNFFESPAGKKVLRRMKELGIKPKSEKVSAKKAAELPLAGKTFVLTGTLPSMTREEASRKNRSARRTCHRQREQENRLRSRRRRSQAANSTKQRSSAFRIIDEAAFRKML